MININLLSKAVVAFTTTISFLFTETHCSSDLKENLIENVVTSAWDPVSGGVIFFLSAVFMLIYARRNSNVPNSDKPDPFIEASAKVVEKSDSDAVVPDADASSPASSVGTMSSGASTPVRSEIIADSADLDASTLSASTMSSGVLTPASAEVDIGAPTSTFPEVSSETVILEVPASWAQNAASGFFPCSPTFYKKVRLFEFLVNGERNWQYQLHNGNGFVSARGYLSSLGDSPVPLDMYLALKTLISVPQFRISEEKWAAVIANGGFWKDGNPIELLSNHGVSSEHVPYVISDLGKSVSDNLKDDACTTVPAGSAAPGGPDVGAGDVTSPSVPAGSEVSGEHDIETVDALPPTVPTALDEAIAIFNETFGY